MKDGKKTRNIQGALAVFMATFNRYIVLDNYYKAYLVVFERLKDGILQKKTTKTQQNVCSD